MQKNKQVRDVIYKYATIPRRLLRIIDTPEFQRLRRIKQLGLAAFVYPSATHTRFEHLLGACHLGGVFMQLLAAQQPELAISPFLVETVQMALLTHDLGHTVFGHLFDEAILPRLHLDASAPQSHEERSIALLRHMCEKYGWRIPASEQKSTTDGNNNEDAHNVVAPTCLTTATATTTTMGDQPRNAAAHDATHKGKDESKQQKQKEQDNDVDCCSDGYFTEEQLRIVEAMILGKPLPNYPRWWFQIVCNPDFALDIDKLDYLCRDSYAVGLPRDLQVERILSHARVIDGRITFHVKVAELIVDVFRHRAKMHSEVYRHRVVVGIDHMVCEIMDAVAEAQGWREYFSDTHTHRWSVLTDDVLYQVPDLARTCPDAPHMQRALHLYERLLCRRLRKTRVIRGVSLDSLTSLRSRKKIATNEEERGAGADVGAAANTDVATATNAAAAATTSATTTELDATLHEQTVKMTIGFTSRPFDNPLERIMCYQESCSDMYEQLEKEQRVSAAEKEDLDGMASGAEAAGTKNRKCLARATKSKTGTSYMIKSLLEWGVWDIGPSHPGEECVVDVLDD